MKKWIAFGLLLIFTGFAMLVFVFGNTAMDERIDQAIRGMRSEKLTPFVIAITQFGSFKVELLIALICALWLLIRYRAIAKTSALLGSLIGAILLNTALKNLFQRPRPELERLMEATGYSFPSGHAMMTSAFYGMLTYLIWLYFKERSRPVAGAAIAAIGAIWIILMGVCRIYLGVHYTTDIVAGFAAGGIWLVVIIGLLGRYRKPDRVRVLQHTPG